METEQCERDQQLGEGEPCLTAEVIHSEFQQLSSSFAETYPDANTPGFVLDVPDNFIKKYIFRSKSKINLKEYEMVTVIIPEVRWLFCLIPLEIFIATFRHLQRMESNKSGYGLRVWPCAPILAWYLFEHRDHLEGKRVSMECNPLILNPDLSLKVLCIRYWN